jgi:hypothetical protein
VSTRLSITTIPAHLATAVISPLRDWLTAPAIRPMTLPGRYVIDLRLPELTFNVTPRRVRGVPLTAPAGRYRLTVKGEPPSATAPGGVMMLQLPEGMTLVEALAAAASETDAPPAFYYDSLMPGGAEIGEDGTSVTVIDLLPGKWIVAGYAMTTEPTIMHVTGEMPANLPEPVVDAALTVGEGTIAISEGALQAGENHLKIENTGVEPHFVTIERVPDGTTVANLEATMRALLGEAPAAATISDSDFVAVAVTADQSGGTTMWMPVTLEPGTYAITSWSTDPRAVSTADLTDMYRVVVIE